MEPEAIRKSMHDHPRGVVIRRVDGERLTVPHRDVATFVAPREMLGDGRVPRVTSVRLFENGSDMPSLRLIDALPLAEVAPLRKSGNGGHRSRLKKK